MSDDRKAQGFEMRVDPPGRPVFYRREPGVSMTHVVGARRCTLRILWAPNWVGRLLRRRPWEVVYVGDEPDRWETRGRGEFYLVWDSPATALEFDSLLVSHHDKSMWDPEASTYEPPTPGSPV